MKYIKSRPSNSHGQPLVHEFVFGTEELILLKALVVKATTYFPRTVETQTALNRLANMRKIMSDALTAIGKK